MPYLRWLQDLSRADFLKSVGLYVMRDRLFLVRIRKNLFRLSVLDEEMVEIPLAGEAGSRREALTEAILSLLRHFDPAKDGPFYICLSPDQAISCQLFLPEAAEENLAQVLEYEIARQLPFRREEVYYDFLPVGKKGDKVGLFLFAVPKKNLDELLQTLSALGVKPKGVETTVTALSNYLLFCTGELTGPALVLGGQNQLFEMVGLDAKKNGWRQEAEILFSHWLPQSDWVLGLGREIFRSCLRESPRCFGWGAIEDFSSMVNGGSLQFEDLIALGKEKLVGEREMTDSFFLPAVGTALRGLREAALPANLLPGTKREKQGSALSWLNTGLSIMLLIGLLIWGGSYPVKDEIRLRQLQKENQKLGPSLEALRREEEKFNKLRTEMTFLSGLKERKGETLLVLNELSRIIPNSAYLSNLRFRDGTIELQGSAENAASLVPILARSPVFQNAGFNAPSNRGRDNRETFSLKAEVKGPDGKATKP
jgi:Tfp pilus assembly protein PilN